MGGGQRGDLGGNRGGYAVGAISIVTPNSREHLETASISVYRRPRKSLKILKPMRATSYRDKSSQLPIYSMFRPSKGSLDFHQYIESWKNFHIWNDVLCPLSAVRRTASWFNMAFNLLYLCIRVIYTLHKLETKFSLF